MIYRGIVHIRNKRTAPEIHDGVVLVNRLNDHAVCFAANIDLRGALNHSFGRVTPLSLTLLRMNPLHMGLISIPLYRLADGDP